MSQNAIKGGTGEERRRILEMLSEGRISVEEAERLFEALDKSAPARGAEASPRYLRVVVEEAGERGDKVNIRVPLSLIRAGMKAGMKLKDVMAKQAQEHVRVKLFDKGMKFDMPEMKPEDIEELIEALGDLRVEVNGSDGEEVRVFCE